MPSTTQKRVNVQKSVITRKVLCKAEKPVKAIYSKFKFKVHMLKAQF